MGRRRSPKAKKESVFLAGLAGLCLALFLFTLAVVLTLNAGWLYRLNIGLLNLEAESGMTAADIKANYDALIAYNRLFFRGPLVFPTLPMSEGGAIHFREVKRIFDVIQMVCPAAGVLGIGLLCLQNQQGRRKSFLTAGILSIAVPAVLGILVAADWERFFVSFHRLFFNNDYWLFDPALDPVILILPDTYFLQCAVMILLIIAAGAAFFLIRGRRRRERRRRSYR